MKVVLLKEVRKLGHAGEIREVNNGYARNFLIPGGLADMVTKHSLSVLKAKGNKLVKQKKKEEEKKSKLAKKIDGMSFEIKMKADEKGTLYAKLDPKAIVRELEKKIYNIEPSEIKLNQTIKSLGQHEVELELGGEKASIKLEVTHLR